MDHQSEVNWLLGLSEGRATCRRAPTPDITEIASNLDHTNRLDVQQNIVNADGDADEPEDISGVAVAINALSAPKLKESGLNEKGEGDGRRFEPDGNPDKSKQKGEGDVDAKSLDARVKAVRTDFESKHGSDARAMLRSHVMNDAYWSKDDEPIRKALQEMCEDDKAWDVKMAAHARMGGTAGGYDNTSRCYG